MKNERHLKAFNSASIENIKSMHDTLQKDAFSSNQYDGVNIEHDQRLNFFHLFQ